MVLVYSQASAVKSPMAINKMIIIPYGNNFMPMLLSGGGKKILFNHLPNFFMVTPPGF
jgi:hypothetical protein